MMSLGFLAGLSVTMKIAIVVGLVLLVFGLIRKVKRLIKLGLIIAIIAALANFGIIALPF